MNDEARQLIAALQLQPLPHEGGFFRQTWRSVWGSAIYFLMTDDNFSAIHRLVQDETWHFYDGDPVDHIQLDPWGGSATVVRMGPAVLAGDIPQVHVAPGQWQAARIAPDEGKHGWALLGCTVFPPWDERGFELGAREELLARFPGQARWIHALTR